MDKILILETLDVGAAYTAQAIQNLGYEPVFICNQSAYQGETLSQIRNYLNYDLLNTSKVENILALINKKGISNIAGVISLLDGRIKAAAALAMELKIPGNDKACITYLHNKARVQDLIPEFCPPAVVFNKNAIPFNELKIFFNKYKKLIIKPSASVGAIGVITIDSQEQLEQVKTLISRQFIQTDDWLAQPYVNGTLFSLEGFVVNGNVNFIGYSKRYKVDYTESINIFPVSISDILESQSKTAVIELVRRSGYLNGYFHVEFIITDTECYLIDANFGRIGAGGLSQQVAIAFNRNPVELYEHIIDVTLFNATKSKKNLYAVSPIETASIHYGISQASMIRNIKLPAKRSFYHTQIIDNNSFMLPFGENNLSWLGIAVDRADRVFQEVDQIEIITTKGTEKPYYLRHNQL